MGELALAMIGPTGSIFPKTRGAAGIAMQRTARTDNRTTPKTGTGSLRHARPMTGPVRSSRTVVVHPVTISAGKRVTGIRNRLRPPLEISSVGPARPGDPLGMNTAAIPTPVGVADPVTDRNRPPVRQSGTSGLAPTPTLTIAVPTTYTAAGTRMHSSGMPGTEPPLDGREIVHHSCPVRPHGN